ncbi:CHRD domain-containing protein [Myxococcota bacterium]|nr:CHRD domain-containing protein [Myxococcota bacterium]
MVSAAFPNGDVRGQIANVVRFPLSPRYLVTPPTNAFGAGTCLSFLNPGRTTLVVSCTHALNGASPTSASLMRGAFGTNGALIASLGNGTSPIMQTIALSLTDLADYLAGNTYVVVNTAGAPTGAIRGQVAQIVEGRGGSNQAVPQTASTATASCRWLLAPDNATLTTSCTHDVPMPLQAVLLRATPWTPGAQLADLGTGTSPINASVTLSAADLALFQSGGLAVEIRSLGYPAGELRAQVAANYSVLADGRQAMPETHLGRTARCLVHLVPAETNLLVECIHDVFDVTIAHFHIGHGDISGEFRDPRFPNPTSPIIASQPLTYTDVANFLDGEWYIHFHSISCTAPNGVPGSPTNFDGWELRGQVAETFDFVLTGAQMVPPSADASVLHCFMFIPYGSAAATTMHCDHPFTPTGLQLMRGAAGTNGTLLQTINLFHFTANNSDSLTWRGGLFGTVPSDIRAGNVYLQATTPPIRGQILPDCPTPGLACNNRCGDGVVVSPETCDDGNTTSGDGCSATCTTE